MTRGLPDEISSQLIREFGEIQHFQPVAGGSINAAGMVQTPNGRFFVKWNDARTFPGMFEAEQRGLNLLAESGEVLVPGNIRVIGDTEYSALICEYIETQRGSSALWSVAGASLARLHSRRVPLFGLDHDNYMGSLTQSNRQHEAFDRFFMEERIMPQVRLAYDSGLLGHNKVRKFESLRVTDYLPDEPSCLVHGDLWGGNIIFDSTHPYFIDPAVAWSSRHTDLAMTTMFGRFPEAFYDSYKEVYPYSTEEEKCWDLLKLYPLLIHVNLFGAGYLHETIQILDQYS